MATCRLLRTSMASTVPVCATAMSVRWSSVTCMSVRRSTVQRCSTPPCRSRRTTLLSALAVTKAASPDTKAADCTGSRCCVSQRRRSSPLSVSHTLTSLEEPQHSTRRSSDEKDASHSGAG